MNSRSSIFMKAFLELCYDSLDDHVPGRVARTAQKCIEEHKQERIIFLASPDSVVLTGEILKGSEPNPAAVYEITKDPNYMFDAYKAAWRCVDRAGKAGTSPEDVVVDYTGKHDVYVRMLDQGGVWRRDYNGFSLF